MRASSPLCQVEERMDVGDEDGIPEDPGVHGGRA